MSNVITFPLSSKPTPPPPTHAVFTLGSVVVAKSGRTPMLVSGYTRSGKITATFYSIEHECVVDKNFMPEDLVQICTETVTV